MRRIKSTGLSAILAATTSSTRNAYPWFAESAYQGMKFHPHRPDLVKACMRASSARSAANIGRDYRNPLRDDWDNLLALGKNPYQGIMLDDGRGESLVIERTKDLEMAQVVLAKFSQGPTLKGLLLSTGDRPIIEASPTDAYWGWGPDQTGVNRLGLILMLVRDQIRKLVTP